MPHPDVYIRDHDDVPRPLVALATDYEQGQNIDWHSHSQAQLVFASAGSLSVHTDDEKWVVPSERAVWIPASVPHKIRTLTAVQLRTIYVETDRFTGLPTECCVIRVLPLLRELILEFSRRPRVYDEAGADGRLASLVIDQIKASGVSPLKLPYPRTKALQSVANEIMTDPAGKSSIGDTAKNAGFSTRTFERRFTAETGMTFRTWCVQARLLKAVEHLSTGMPVGDVAFQLGYSSTSAFVAAFRKSLGMTPGQYFRDEDDQA